MDGIQFLEETLWYYFKHIILQGKRLTWPFSPLCVKLLAAGLCEEHDGERGMTCGNMLVPASSSSPWGPQWWQCGRVGSAGPW